jgi:hypothetical protein
MKSTKDLDTSDRIVTGGSSKTAAAGGVDLLFAGFVGGSGTGRFYAQATYLWTSSKRSTTEGIRRIAGYDSPGFDRSAWVTTSLLSVRCKKDSND